MLSFSTKGSAKHELVDKVVEATRILHEIAPQLNADGDCRPTRRSLEKVVS
jgi:phosphate acetyltransferase